MVSNLRPLEWESDTLAPNLLHHKPKYGTKREFLRQLKSSDTNLTVKFIDTENK